jgi:hypothetical protein
MIPQGILARGLALSALVLCICACTPPPKAQPPADDSPEAALAALRTGDVDRLRAVLGKGDGLLQRAREHQKSLDPEAWRVALGVPTRQHDMVAATRALSAGDEAALREALGCGEQALRTDILNATHSIATVRAGDRNFYREAEPPVQALDGWFIPALPEGAIAYHFTTIATVGEKRVQLNVGRGRDGMLDLRATFDLSGVKPRTAAQRADTLATLLPPAMQPMETAWADDARFSEVTLRLLLSGGTLCVARAARVEGQWAPLEASCTTITERLHARTDAQLQRILNAANEYARQRAKWPPDASVLTLGGHAWAEPGALGWGEFSANPPRGFELLQARNPADIAVIALQSGPQGRRAINRMGNLLWSQ